MMRALALARWRVARRDWTSPPGSGGWARHPGVALLIALGLALFVHAGLVQAFSSLAESDAGARTGLLAIALSGALLALLAFDVDDTVRSLLLDPDVTLLRRAPIGPAALLLIKALDSAPRTLLPLAVLAVPAIAAFLAGSPAPLAGALAAVAALAALWLMTLAAGLALSLALLRLAPANHVREALGVVSALMLTVIWIAGALVLPRALAIEPVSAGSLGAMLAVAGDAAGPAASAARAIAAAGAGEFGPLPRELGVLALGALLGAAAMLLAGRWALEAVLDRISGASAPGRSAALSGATPAPPWRGGSVAGAIVRRDARMLRRSWTLMSDLLVTSMLWALLPLAGLAGGSFEAEGLARLVLLTLSVGLGYEVAARSIPFERHADFWVRVTPVPATRYIAGKLLGASGLAAPLVLLVAGALLASDAVRPSDLLHLTGWTCGALLLAQSTGLWAGARFGDPEWVNPRAMLRFAGRLVASVLVLAQLGGWLGLMAAFERFSPGVHPVVEGGIALVLGSLVAIVPIRAASCRLGGLIHTTKPKPAREFGGT